LHAFHLISPFYLLQRTWALPLFPWPSSLQSFVERGGFHQRSRHLLATLSSCAARYVLVTIIGLPITSQHLSNQTLVQPRVG
jgi:hypothetical protein